MSADKPLSVDKSLAVDTPIEKAIDAYLDQVAGLLMMMPREPLRRTFQRLQEAQRLGQKVFICGNGGSAATATHFACDLAKGTLAPNRPRLKVMSLCDNVSLLTAWANDVSYDEVFAENGAAWMEAGDVLVAISGSGNSRNVLRAVSLARAVGATTIGFVGSSGGRLKDRVDICVRVPGGCLEQVEDIHLVVCHLLALCLRSLPAGAAPSPLEPAGAGAGLRSAESVESEALVEGVRVNLER